MYPRGGAIPVLCNYWTCGIHSLIANSGERLIFWLNTKIRIKFITQFLHFKERKKINWEGMPVISGYMRKRIQQCTTEFQPTNFQIFLGRKCVIKWTSRPDFIFSIDWNYCEVKPSGECTTGNCLKGPHWTMHICLRISKDSLQPISEMTYIVSPRF